jgi:hypothetical protein
MGGLLLPRALFNQVALFKITLSLESVEIRATSLPCSISFETAGKSEVKVTLKIVNRGLQVWGQVVELPTQSHAFKTQ